MDEIIWLYASLWLALLALGGMLKRKELTVIGTLIGLLFGMVLISEELFLAFALIILNFVLLVLEAKPR